MRRFILLVSLALLLLVSLSLTELADTPAAPDVLQRQGVVLEVNVDDALWLQPQAASADAATLNGWTTIVSEDFEGAFPGEWTVFDNEPGSGEYHWAKRDCKAYSGVYAGWAVGGGGDGAGLSCGADYPDDADAVMIYGPFSLADATAADLTF